MKKLILLAALLFPFFAIAQFGVLDNDFDADGVATFDVGPQGSYLGHDVQIQQDGNILFLGTSPTPEGVAAVVVRLFPDGSVDQSFGTTGAVYIIGPDFETDGREMIIQPDGKVVITGAAELNGVYGVFFTRLNQSDGSLDASFGVNGTIHIPYPSDSYLVDVALQSDGKIVAAGYSTESDTDVLVVRLTQDGFLDNSFSFDGKVTTDINDIDVVQGLVIGDDGRITVAGVSESQIGMFTLTESLLIRYNSDGTLDNSFGTNGIITHDLNGYSYLNDIVFAESGKMYGCGVVEGSSDKDFLVAKFNANGSLDNSFGVGGFKETDFENGDDEAKEVLFQPDGRILVAGSAAAVSGTEGALIRHNNNGLYDSSFGNVGKVVASIDDESIYDELAIQSDLKIIALGTSLDGTTTKAAMARYTSGMNVGIGEVEASIGSTLVYPNPITDNTVTVEYELAADQEVSIELLDLNGKLISTPQSEMEEAAGTYQKQLSIPKVASGTYLLNLETAKGSVSVRVSVN